MADNAAYSTQLKAISQMTTRAIAVEVDVKRRGGITPILHQVLYLEMSVGDGTAVRQWQPPKR